MKQRIGIYRLANQKDELAGHSKLGQAAAAISLLQQPMPDTFLGRKTQEPFPKQDE